MRHLVVHRKLDYGPIFLAMGAILFLTVGLAYLAYRRVGLPVEAVEEMIFYALLVGYTYPITRSLNYYKVFDSIVVTAIVGAAIGWALASFLAPSVQRAVREKLVSDFDGLIGGSAG